MLETIIDSIRVGCTIFHHWFDTSWYVVPRTGFERLAEHHWLSMMKPLLVGRDVAGKFAKIGKKINSSSI